MIIRTSLLAIAAVIGSAPLALAAPPVPDASTSATSPTDSIIRHAAAREFLEVSRSSERQRVLLYDSLLSARSDLAGECVNRAAEGRRLTGCGITDSSNEQLRDALQAHEEEILDRVMVVSEEVYANRFTVAELNDISRFFRTRVGRKYAATYPVLLDDVQHRKRQILENFLLHEVRAAPKPKAAAAPR